MARRSSVGLSGRSVSTGLVSLVLLTMLASSCLGATFYVSTTGSDANDGTGPDDAHAWRTIDNGDIKQLVAPGDKVIVLPGEYAPISITKVAGVTYEAQGAATIRNLSGTALTVRGTFWGAGAADNTVIDGFEIIGDSPVGAGSSQVLHIYCAKGVVVRNCKIGGNPNGVYWSMGVFCYVAQNTYVHNNVVDMGGGGVCLIDQFYLGGNRFFNNTLVGFARAGLEHSYGTYASEKNDFKNNILVGPGRGILVTAAGDDKWLAHSFNAFHGVSSPYSGTTAGYREMVADPLLDPDYTLQAGSPAIDAGIYVGIAFNGSAPDLGAMESAGPAGQAGTLCVTVLNGVTGQPVPGADVALSDVVGRVADYATDSAGVSCAEIVPGTYGVAVSKTGLPSGSKSGIVVVGGQTTHVEVILGDASQGLVTGYVYREPGNLPISGAVVKASKDGVILEGARTDASGRYEMSVEMGSVRLDACAPGHLTETETVSVPAGGTAVQNFILEERFDTATFYVSPTGNNFNDGSAQDDFHAWRTVDYGDSGGWLIPGDTVIVLEGDYPAATLSNCGEVTYTAQGNAVIGSSAGSVLTIKGNTFGNNAHADNLTIEGFTLHGDSPTGAAYTYIVKLEFSRNVTIRNCKFTGAGNGVGWSMGLWSYYAEGVQVHNNLFATSGYGVGAIDQYFVGGSSFNNNTFTDFARSGFELSYLYAPMGNVAVRNNIFSGSGPGIRVVDSSGVSWFAHSHNLFDTVAGPVLGDDLRTGEFSADPLFVDPAGDFRLLYGSPAIDAGVDVGLFYQGTSPDLGAFETTPLVGQTGTVAGVVRDALFLTPIAGARVTLGVGSTPIYGAITDTNGAYSVAPISGEYTVTGSAPGYQSDSASVVVTAPGSVVADLNLQPLLFVTSSIREALEQSNPSVLINGCVVTSDLGVLTGDAFYVEDASRAAGVKVAAAPGFPNLTAGQRLSLRGEIGADASGEPLIVGSAVLGVTDGDELGPLGMPGKSVGGTGLTSLGLLVRIWGMVTHVAAGGGYFCLDDGSGKSDGLGHSGVPVVLSDLVESVPSGSIPSVGSFRSVTGIVGLADLGGGAVPVVRIRGVSDLN